MIDWGLAKVIGEADDAVADAARRRSPTTALQDARRHRVRHARLHGARAAARRRRSTSGATSTRSARRSITCSRAGRRTTRRRATEMMRARGRRHRRAARARSCPACRPSSSTIVDKALAHDAQRALPRTPASSPRTCSASSPASSSPRTTTRRASSCSGSCARPRRSSRSRVARDARAARQRGSRLARVVDRARSRRRRRRVALRAEGRSPRPSSEKVARRVQQLTLAEARGTARRRSDARGRDGATAARRGTRWREARDVIAAAARARASRSVCRRSPHTLSLEPSRDGHARARRRRRRHRAPPRSRDAARPARSPT